MRVAVLGSWRESDRQEWGLEDAVQFRAAARLLGRRLIELGHSLVVGSAARHTADFGAVRGAVRAATPGSEKRIHVLAARGTRPFWRLSAKCPRLFVPRAIPADGWAPAKVFQVRHADAVVILGGAKGSLQAGLTAAVSGKRLVCIGSFGGAARVLNDLFAQSRNDWDANLPDADTIGILQNGWSDVLADDVLAALRALRKPKLLIIHGRAADRDELKRYLRDTKGLPEPTVLVDLKTPSHLIPDKFEQLASEVDGAIALCTPDDVGSLAGAAGPETLEYRARQNVWLEIGWFWGRLGLRRVLILTRGKVTTPSDLAGVETYPYGESLSDAAEAIDAFLANLGQERA